MTMKVKVFFLSLCVLIWPVLGQAQDEGAGKASSSIYIEMQPAFIVTFGGPGPLKYLKTEVTLIAPDSTAESNIKLHKPAIRHTLVMLLSAQRSENLATATARDHVRQQSIEAIRDVLTEEYGNPGYDMLKNLLFTSFVVQE